MKYFIKFNSMLLKGIKILFSPKVMEIFLKIVEVITDIVFLTIISFRKTTNK